MSASINSDPYKILGVTAEATDVEIKKAYFALVRKHPPERDPEGFKRVRSAYDQLKSRKGRAEIDLFLVEDDGIPTGQEWLKKADGPAPSITAEMIKRDLIAIEAIRLLDELGALAPPEQ
jgi:curved DNA-binding protein CbpA